MSVAALILTGVCVALACGGITAAMHRWMKGGPYER